MTQNKSSAKYSCIKELMKLLGTKDLIGLNGKKLSDLISRERREAVREVVEEMIKLSGDIEMKYDTPEMAEWLAFRRFRNNMRDKLKESI